MPLDLQRIQAICFDVDGTLSDTDDQWTAQFVRLLTPVSRLFPLWNPTVFARRVVMGMESPGNLAYSMLDRLHLDDDLARFYDRWVKSRAGKEKHASFWLIPQVQETLMLLKTHYPLAVVSTRDHTSTLSFLRQFNLHPIFHAIATSQTCEHTKPFPDPLVWAARQMQVEPENCLMVGDTTVDILAGKAAGAQTVGVLCGFGEEKELRRAGADLILPSSTELPEILLHGKRNLHG